MAADDGGPTAIVAQLPTKGECAECVGFNPQPDPPGYPTNRVPHIDNPGYGGPDSLPSRQP